MSEALVHLEQVTRLSSRVVRVLGANPGKFTLQGTNTYLVHAPVPSHSEDKVKALPCVLIDAAEGKNAYIDTLKNVLLGRDLRAWRGIHATDGATLAPSSSAEGLPQLHITDIILTHKHMDHIGGLPSVLGLLAEIRGEQDGAAPPRIHKLQEILKAVAREEDKEADQVVKLLKQCDSSLFTPSSARESVHWLQDGDHCQISSVQVSFLHSARSFPENAPHDVKRRGDTRQLPSALRDQQLSPQTTTLQVLHAPGHTSDHICLLLGQESALYSGDNVLGQGTSVFEDLRVYLQSLERMSDALKRSPAPLNAYGDMYEQLSETSDQERTEAQENRLYPSHGPVLVQGRRTIKQYISHRLERERQVVELLCRPHSASASTEPAWTARTIVQELYREYPESLHIPAARGVFLHLVKLLQDTRIQPVAAPAGHDVLKGHITVRCLDEDEIFKQADQASIGEGTFARAPHAASTWEDIWLDSLDRRWVAEAAELLPSSGRM